MTMHPTPGDTIQIGDITLYAAKADGTCIGCEFREDAVGDTTCTHVICFKVVWLTQQNYIIRLLTS